MKKIPNKLRKILVAFTVCFAIFLLSPFLIQKVEQKNIFTLETIPQKEIAIVFGAGVKDNGAPSDALYDRLTVAADLYNEGKVAKILVSGDNSTENYNEPEVMSQTLQNDFAIPAAAISEDYAGRRTYDTCIRAKEIWGIKEAVLVTQDFHLPRAIYTCSSLGIESVGISASLQPYIFDSFYLVREYAATLKMLVDLYVWTPEYIGGDEEDAPSLLLTK
ncbi:MAG: ElyC/SanA/YdcF family protein [Candidatus Gracilibacteria bacterium]|jgi:vancomycin permeability regulator SanA